MLIRSVVLSMILEVRCYDHEHRSPTAGSKAANIVAVSRRHVQAAAMVACVV